MKHRYLEIQEHLEMAEKVRMFKFKDLYCRHEPTEEKKTEKL
jgi:hypothetical protein